MNIFIILLVIVVLGNLTINLFSPAIQRWKLVWRLLLIVCFGIPIAVVELQKQRGSEYYMRRASENLEKAERVEEDRQTRALIKRYGEKINSITNYSVRKKERDKNIFSEQKVKFPQCYDDFSAARVQRKRGNFHEAEKILIEVVNNCPNFFLAHYNLALVYEAMNNIEKTDYHYKKASALEESLSTRDPSIHNTYGFFLLKNRKFDDSEEEYEKALELDPNHPKAKTGLEAAGKRIIF
ncbi:tetratricopeptide repeat protein [candidate division WOR-3 bacterium]|nr:tetratricopeptide repeat protein [candidate division WOR-3 bacterium]